MPARHRDRDLRQALSGTYWSNLGPTTVTRTMHVGLQESSEDYIGNFDVVNPLDLYRKEVSYPTLSGTRYNSGGTKLREFVDFPLGYRPGVTDPRIGYPSYSFPELSALAWKILAETNPSAPHVSLPSFAGELKDWMGLIKSNGDAVLDIVRHFRGNSATRNVFKRLAKAGWAFGSLEKGRVAESLSIGELIPSIGSAYLNWRWALKPLYNDLRAMLDFTKAVNDRLTWLYHLRTGKYLRRRCHLGTSRKRTGPTNVTLHSEGTIITGKRTVDYTSEVWGTAQWKLDPASQIPQMGVPRLEALAKALSLGLTSSESLATAWQLCPWSWFIDWFTNLDDTIAATNNAIGCTWSKIALMRKTTSVATYTVNLPLQDSWVILGNQYHYELGVRKERWPITPVLPFSLTYLPILDGGKWSILGAIASQKRLIAP